jgi:hypothetical protein
MSSGTSFSGYDTGVLEIAWLDREAAIRVVFATTKWPKDQAGFSVYVREAWRR